MFDRVLNQIMGTWQKIRKVIHFQQITCLLYYIIIDCREFTALPHYPGSDQSKELAEKLKDLWVDHGFEDVKLYKYNIYLSYPQKPGEITLYGGMNKTLKIMNEPSFDESENTTNILYPFNAFAKTGSVTVSEVYTINKQSHTMSNV